MNGSGKTTLLSIIAGFRGYTSGSVNVFGSPYTEENILEKRKRVGWISSSFFDTYYQREAVLNIVLSGISGKLGMNRWAVTNDDIKRAKSLLIELGLKDKMHRTFDLLSKGERQNVLIARALISDPELLILDEPGTGLDVFAREYMLATVRALAANKERTIIYVTHYTEEILDIFDKYGIEIKSFLPKYRRHSCVASKYFAFVIGPEGELYKCWRMVGNQKEAIGNVNDGSFDMVKFSKYLIGADYTLDSKCLQCEFITLCGGGCPLVRMRNKYEKISLNHCCPEKTHMEQLMELRYEMFVKSHQKQ